MTESGRKNELSGSRTELTADRLLTVAISGKWQVGNEHPSATDIVNQLPGADRIAFDSTGLGDWDTSLVTYLVNIIDAADKAGKRVDQSGLPEGVQGLLTLAYAVAEREGARREDQTEPILVRVGNAALDHLAGWRSGLEFIGSSTIAFSRFATGQARFQKADLFRIIQDAGPAALGIVGLINFLVGMILAFVGAVQLQTFGAGIYVADLVGIAMTREMAAIMTGIIMAGRTGAAFAAQLGTMTVNEEIDALKTMGFSPMEFLVLPRMLALLLMMPLLGVYAALMGILGGFVVGVGMLGISPALYYHQTIDGVDLTSFAIGIVKCTVFGAVVALSGCLRGMQCGRSSAAVGVAATSAVVTAIVWIIVLDAVFSVMTEILGI
jgi:phospholipid/cholesterol/gamma-HCH transport system permease protein